MSRIDSFSDPFLTTWPVSGQVVILDLEYTSWKGSMERNWSVDWEFREIVQIGAVRVKVESDTFINEETFERLVKPVRNPRLSDHFSTLTGITDALVSEKGRCFTDALGDFIEFVQSSQIWSMGFDGEVLRENTTLNRFPYPFHRNQVLNIRPAFSKILNLPEADIMSCKLPEILGLKKSENNHTALDDSLTIFRALNHMRKEGLV
jgi:inhibitor of KinA sporulation pathway (predicted exonuclease)